MAAGEKYSGHRISESLRLIVIVSLLSYLARGLLRDAADDALDALHPHLQLHAGVTAHCPSPHRVVVVLAVVVYLSTGRRGWARQPLPAAHFTDGSA